MPMNDVNQCVSSIWTIIYTLKAIIVRECSENIEDLNRSKQNNVSNHVDKSGENNKAAYKCINKIKLSEKKCTNN